MAFGISILLPHDFSPPDDPRFKETFFLVEATHFERMCLGKRDEWEGWEEQSSGYICQVGTLARRPVTVGVSWARIKGKLVGFWEAESQVVDYAMIEKWLDKYWSPPKWDGGTRNARCNAMNFHHCIHAIREANEAELSTATT
ncbi:MAG: hypothetical protein WAV25_00465 [Minisyncoccia bacterium]